MNPSPPDVTLTRRIPGKPADVFAAWLDREALSHFMCPAQGATVTKVEVDARVGGAFLIVMRVAGRDVPHGGEYLVIEPDTRLEFTWRSEHAGEGSRVALTFEPAPGGTTLLTLTHSGLSEESARRAHEGGWTGILSTLAAFSASHPAVQ